MSLEIYRPGLEGVIAGETQVCSVEQDGLFYRGYSIAELSEHSSFEESAYLVLYGQLPTAIQFAQFKKSLDEFRILPKPLIDSLRLIPSAIPMMDVLRTAVSMVGHFDPVQGDDRFAWQNRTIYLTAQIAGIIAARHRLLQNAEVLPPKPGLSHAAQLLYQFNGQQPSDEAARLLDLTLILYMEHEFNASTFTARIAASTLSDLCSCIVAGIGALKGPLHGGANEEVMQMLSQFKSADDAQKWIYQAFAAKTKIMGFGHRVYKNGDHRAVILENKMRSLAINKKQEKWLEIYDCIKNIMKSEKNIFPNLDYPCGLTYFLLELPIDVYTPLFVASRVIGWGAHAIEQHFNNRIIRPRSRYTGPTKRSYMPITQRT